MRAKRRQQGRSSGDPGGYFDDSLIQFMGGMGMWKSGPKSANMLHGNK
jgi:hypothetical protein